MTKRWTITCVLLFLSLVGCNQNEGAHVSPNAEPPATVVGPSGCGDLQGLLEDGVKLGGDLRGDVTGDGSEEVVYLLRSEVAEAGCRDLLVVEGPGGTVASQLSDGRQYALERPRLNTLAQIDDHPGVEIVADLEQGASTQFVGIFTFREGGIVRVTRQDSHMANLFPYGGSVGHIEASDCGTEDGTVIVSTATPAGARYAVQRLVHRFQDTLLLVDRSASEQVQVAAEEVQQLPEYQGPPFGSCAPS